MGEQPPSPLSEDEQNRIEDARNSLLAHYSSKSTNQTAILLGLAIVFFTVIQVALIISSKWERIWFLVLSAGFIIFIGTRAVGRLIAYGELATNVVHVKIADRDKIGNFLSFDFEKYKLSSQNDIDKFKQHIRNLLIKKSDQGEEPTEKYIESVVESIKNLDLAPTYLKRLDISAQFHRYLVRYKEKQKPIYRVRNIIGKWYVKYVCYPIVVFLFGLILYLVL
jgi:hypothetical protein